MTPRCDRCHRPLKNASESGFGPRCEVYVLGTKHESRQRRVRCKVRRSADDRQAELPLEVRS